MFKNYIPEKDGMSFLTFVADMEGIASRKVDLVCFNTCDPLTRHQILKYGKLLIDMDVKARVELMVKAMIDYEEYQSYLNLGINIVRKDLASIDHHEKNMRCLSESTFPTSNRWAQE